MPTDDRDAASLWDMVQAIEEIQEDTAGLSYENFLESRIVRRAVERNLVILGEAARRVSVTFQTEHTDIDWRNIIGLRNVLAHRYEVIRYETLWEVIGDVLPELKTKLQALFPVSEDNE